MKCCKYSGVLAYLVQYQRIRGITLYALYSFTTYLLTYSTTELLNVGHI